MTRSHSLLPAVAAVLTLSASAQLTLCGMVDVETRSSQAFYFAAIRPDGSLGRNVTLTQESVSGMLAGDAKSGRFVYSPPLSQQQTVGLISVDTTARSATAYALHNPVGFDGPLIVGDLVPSDVSGDVIAIMASSGSKSWACVAELTPADGVPRIRYNLTLEATGFAEISSSFSAFDPRTRTVFLIAAFNSNQQVVAVPLDAPASSSLVNASLPDGFAMIGITYAAAINSVVAIGLVAPPQVYGLVALNMQTLVWSNLTTWSSDNFYLSGLGEIAVDPTEGRYIYTVLSNATGFHTIPVVDALSGKEVRRITMVSDSYFVSSLTFCNATFAHSMHADAVHT